MKLTPAEYKLLDAVLSVEGGLWYRNLKRWPRLVARRAKDRGLINKRTLKYAGLVVATALGKRSHARGK